QALRRPDARLVAAGAAVLQRRRGGLERGFRGQDFHIERSLAMHGRNQEQQTGKASPLHFFLMRKVNSLFASAWDSSSCPVCLEKVWKSLTAPGSVASTLRTCPDCMPLSAFLVRRIGSGQFRPRASSSRSKSIKYYAASTSRGRRCPEKHERSSLHARCARRLTA